MQNIDLANKTILITGVAGFIGSNLTKKLLSDMDKIKIIGLDNMNDYYDVRLKEARISEISDKDNFIFIKGDFSDKELVFSIFKKYSPSVIVHLGAQAGVRYSISNPDKNI